MAGADHEDFKRIRSPFVGERIVLRPLEEEDVPRLNQMFNDPDVLQFLSFAWPEPVTDTRSWQQRARQDPSGQTFAVETDAGELVGACSI